MAKIISIEFYKDFLKIIFRRPLKNNKFFQKLIDLMVDGNISKKLANQNTNICIEGFPRSGNSFACRIIRITDPWIKISDHTHSIANVKSASENHVPIVILIRKPLDAIVSYVLRRIGLRQKTTKEMSLRLAFKDYYIFYQYIYKQLNNLNNTNKIKIIKFETLINETSTYLETIENLINIDFQINSLEDLNKLIDRTNNQLKTIASKKTYENPITVSYP